MFLENFKNEYLWRKFIEEYKKTRTKRDSVKNRYLDSVVADENIWSFIIGAFFDSFKVPVIIITSTTNRAKELSRELKCMLEKVKIFNYPGLGSSIFYKNKAASASGNLPDRLNVISNLLDFQKNRIPFLIISTSSALMNLMPHSRIPLLNNITLTTGHEYNREKLLSDFTKKGYERVHEVYDRGEFSIRGGIVDVFDITGENPIRIDFFSDIVDKIVTYDISGQNLVENLNEISICPNLNPWEIEEELDKEGKGYAYSMGYNQKMLSIIDLLRKYVGEFGAIVCDPLEVCLKVKSDIDIFEKSFSGDEKNLITKYKSVVNSYIAGKDFLEEERFELKLNLISTVNESKGRDEFVFDQINKQKKSSGNSTVFVQNLKKDLKSGSKVIISLKDGERRKKIKEILLNNSVSYNDLKRRKKLDFSRLNPEIINIFDMQLYRGYESQDVSLYGELDIYEQTVTEEPDREIILSRAFEEFSPENYVVHKNHGIGKYINIVSRQIDGHKREYFLIEYADSDRLYVPTWQADRIHKYIGDKEPKITSLSSRKWSSLKKKARSSVHKLAIDLAKLYAERKSAEGFAFPDDSPWQKEIEDLFPFKETSDQVKAINYVKESMKMPKPMDILVCGDVGFGKTEVAVRAAFKAIESGKQVLMLAPTTILADQHYRTFSQRYRDYPVILEVLSRFRTKKEQRKIVEDFRDGRVDMLIGTHRILQDDIIPKDLGLIIVDEEQRFGVNSKEKLKLLKKEVDALTLTATPIPRTLYISLTGIRDTVLIETYPEGRYPIETFVGRKDNSIIKMAIERELARGGQVYYVCSRITGIENERQKLQQLIPEARIALAHGQIDGRTIEKVMDDFIGKKYDVLLTTSIIESGMDIGSVNTLVVINSHRFGLSQLYQLRGRVGRSSEKAYAYFFYPNRENLNLSAFQRLKTLAEYTDLGSGYSIAMRDLEIRGAGELLGPRQHGHINSIGFDMYCQIMREEVERLKGNVVEEDINVQIDLPLSAYIPKNYIKNEKDRINVYKMLGSANNFEDINKILKGVERRYRKAPFVTGNLFDIVKIKCLLRKAKIEKLVFIRGKGVILKKVNMSGENAARMNTRDSNLVYRPKNKEVIIKIDKNMNLNLVLRYINDIIDFI